MQKLALIEAVERFPALWDNACLDYEDMHQRNELWRCILTDLEASFCRRFSRVVLQNKFKNLRDMFMRKMRDQKEALTRTSEAAAGTLEKIIFWPFYDSSKYLLSCNDAGTICTNVAMEEAVEGASQCRNISSFSKPRAPICHTTRDTVRINTRYKKQQTKGIQKLAEALTAPYNEEDRFETLGKNLLPSLLILLYSHLCLGIPLTARLRDRDSFDTPQAEIFTQKAYELQVELSRAILAAKTCHSHEGTIEDL
ncbi:hypothetical protein ANCCAN_11310 [Ancylostoma caninum]|uniref:MADF domain-containing protein n=1 Tax=Ancylostoma caninum TaxID=29170 RepID=A0A368GEC4_ANCCA|nr:hypothetical protein ANCCAN_11310 [Ancylostoma caninum]